VKPCLGPGLLLGALSLGLLLGVAQCVQQSEVQTSSSCYAIDGDTLDCNGERIRLNGIDAPEKGTGIAAFKSHQYLQLFITNSKVTWHPLKQDRYGRTVAQVFAHDADLSCAMVLSGNAVYVRKWDEQQLTGKCIKAAGDL
jgi:micrococcal nuclease